MSTNIGVDILVRIKEPLIQIEDNIGEGIHLHYKNIRYDFSIRDFLSYANGCKEALDKLNQK